VTHDELIALLDEVITDDVHHLATQTALALRAVAQLHEPGDYGHDSWQSCLHCSCQDCHTFIVYPCTTIQALEKELT
jgi:hypothetical protein